MVSTLVLTAERLHYVEELQDDYDELGEEAFSFREVYSGSAAKSVREIRRIEKQYIESRRGLLYNSNYYS
ncbi:hypothetical protein [Microbulbifer aggregans]|uniref:hypothetical protein n=1 Tax=Microbulbifer aggregans TaxID=1769779 RepID=UPI001CFCD3B8|nr:hypothetical protein [Microbulbifer aggregans]